MRYLEPSFVPKRLWPIGAKLRPKGSVTVHHGGAGTTAATLRAGKPTGSCQFWQTFGKYRSFSAVSKRNFASKYAFDSICQNLPDYLADSFEILQNCKK